MLPNIPRNAVKHSGECPQRLKGMRKQGQFKISENLEYRILHGICSRRQVNNEAAEARSNYKKSYFWWFRNSACGDWTGSNRTEHPGGKVVYILGEREERGEEWWCDFVCVERLGLMIGLLNVGFIDFFSTCGFQY